MVLLLNLPLKLQGKKSLSNGNKLLKRDHFANGMCAILQKTLETNMCNFSRGYQDKKETKRNKPNCKASLKIGKCKKHPNMTKVHYYGTTPMTFTRLRI